MLITDKEKYIDRLVSLWHEVFGDSEDYIKLFFKEAYFDCECFAEVMENEIVSALYLLKCSINYRGKIYKGRYLYAAATLPAYRGKGLMSTLIDEALNFAQAEELDFIALVPANDSLYNYYGKFGFIGSMYKYRLRINNEGSSFRAFREITDPCEFDRLRNKSDCDMLVYNSVGNKYAFECLRFSGQKVYAVDESSYYIENEEFFSSSDDSAYSADTLISSLSAQTELFTNCALEDSEKIRNGMIYSLKEKVDFKDIYMNIALD